MTEEEEEDNDSYCKCCGSCGHYGCCYHMCLCRGCGIDWDSEYESSLSVVQCCNKGKDIVVVETEEEFQFATRKKQR